MKFQEFALAAGANLRRLSLDLALQGVRTLWGSFEIVQRWDGMDKRRSVSG